MKKPLYLLVTFLLLMACDEENPQPVDRVSGSYHFSDPGVPIEIAFDIVNGGNQRYNFENRYVSHPAIPESERDNNQIRTYDKFDGGYGMIEIFSRGAFYYKITLIYNRFTEEGMMVYDIQIDIPSEPYIVLPDQVFERR